MSQDDPELALLSKVQRAALGYVRDTVRRLQPDAGAMLTDIIGRAGCTRDVLDAAMESIGAHSRVVLHFHPDRYGTKPISVAEALLQEGEYRSQFETGLTTGSRSAFPGGYRDTWEKTLFGRAYHASGASPSERPKYGALELIRYSDGPWPRFGSCYLVLQQSLGRRASFTFSGSEQALALERVGLIDGMEGVMAPLFAEVEHGEGARPPWPPFVAPTLGLERVTVPRLLFSLARDLAVPRTAPSTLPVGRVLDSGIEAQVHGPIDMRRDVELLVADPSFKGTPTGECLLELCRKYSIRLDWHCGFRLTADQVPEGFRGPSIRQLAQRIAIKGVVDAAVIGAAEASLQARPDTWREWGTIDETLDRMKQLWHVLVHFGTPNSPGVAAAGRTAYSPDSD